MKYSLSWLNEHIDGDLPKANIIRSLVTFLAFEVEEMSEKDGDTIFDIKVLPDRAHDALSHRGMAREVTALLGLKRKVHTVENPKLDVSVVSPRIVVDDTKLCPRYIGVRIDGVRVGPSPKELTQKLERIGERSINNVVDATNIALFDIGQPMHVFDADKVKGGITVRLAKRGEQMMTLDGKSLVLDGSELVIADDEGVLALAGIKGGKKAEVDAKTTSIILESANFDPTLTRRTSVRHGIKTSASKRYENGITSTLAEEGASVFLEILKKQIPTIKVGETVDRYPMLETWEYLVGVSVEEVNRLLGSKMSEKDMKDILARLGHGYEVVSTKKVLEKNIPKVIGKPYANPSSMRRDAPEKFSCSSLVSYLYTLAGVSMPSISVDKYLYGAPVEKKDLRYGDLVFANTGKGHVYSETVKYMPGTAVPEGVDHVGIYLEKGKVLHSSKSTGGVIIEEHETSAMFKNVVGYRRMVEDVNEKRFVVCIPPERLDLRIPADLIEEIGRHYGYDKIPSVLPALPKKGEMSKKLAYGNKIRVFLTENGFSEVVTYSFTNQEETGKIEVLNPVGKDRPFLRKSLTANFKWSFLNNIYFSPLLGLNEVKMFEIGNVFSDKGESTKLAIGIATSDKKRKKMLSGEIGRLLDDIYKMLGFSGTSEKTTGTLTKDSCTVETYEIDLEAILIGSPEPKEYIPLDVSRIRTRYQTLSTFPFAVRDISLFVPSTVSDEKIQGTIKKAGGELVVRFSQFDKFQKPGEDRISYAYRLVFQAFDRTLTDDEVNGYMKNVYDACAKESWQVR